ncbi:pentatricopeptide repeat-containing protein At4g16835, mitochondrial-like [Selaginella moellendorffii]|uniref:pentatricopeptide repeat-containing protein At4g16835, mitochondrial-like n=1 Tax=Selaginella moellendorffii TaxID=88036 RepID=UPI000D1C3EEC|nr:pentatricopeptide repeat-containing protein At4g16835, mitochondrial-like [Selaginella moellendorffii]|eukprot:XP_024544024.1 pentatricopeptide repeat-containing protein At4g16835, mitochondrial-like [Selaginella moellendorffii]
MPAHDLVSSNLALSLRAQEGDLEQAQQLFDRIPAPDSFSWNTLFSAYAHSGHFQAARDVFDRNARNRDEISWASLIAAYAQQGHVDRARQIFDRVPKLDGVAIWNSMLAAYAHHGKDPLDAFSLVSSMAATFQAPPDGAAFAAVLIACSRAGDLERAQEFFASMVSDFQIEPTKQHYCCVVDLLARSGFLDTARDVATSMPFAPDATEWTCLLGAWKNHKLEQRVRDQKFVTQASHKL